MSGTHSINPSSTLSRSRKSRRTLARASSGIGASGDGDGDGGDASSDASHDRAGLSSGMAPRHSSPNLQPVPLSRPPPPPSSLHRDRPPSCILDPPSWYYCPPVLPLPLLLPRLQLLLLRLLSTYLLRLPRLPPLATATGLRTAPTATSPSLTGTWPTAATQQPPPPPPPPPQPLEPPG